MEELAAQSRLSVIGFSTSPATVKRLRARWQAHGFPAERLSIRLGTAAESGLPPYLARLITTEDPAEGGWGGGEDFVATLFQVLRPYGGTMLLEGDHRALFGRSCRSRGLTNSAITRSGGFTRLTRPGAIPGSADWDHQYADAAHSVMAPDQLVKAPLGLLWFGGTVNDNVLPRHGHGPSQLVSHGRLYILGANHVAARDVYTGALLWEKAMSGVGAAFDNTGHESGANHMGSTMVASSNGLYLCHNSGDFMLLDGDTGESVTSFAPTDGSYVAQAVLWEELLVTASDPYEFKAGDRAGKNNWNETCSRELIIMNRFTGQELWSRSASNAWYHNTIIVGSNSLFAIDRLAPGQVDALSRRGLGPVDVGAVFELYALDVKSGEKRWSTTNEVFGTWLGYSEEYDVLIQSTRTSRDMQDSRTKRIIAYSGSDGTVLWDKSQGVAEVAYILHHDKIIMQTHSGSTALELLTGKPYMIKHPLTGAETALSWKRYYGCNTAVASEHLMTFRSGAAGYYDLRTHSGTGNFGGAKSGCTSSYLPANGILNAVDYTRTCSCSYQNQTSMGLIHMPNMEQWTFSTLPAGGTIRQVGINFGAPGDRVSDAGTLWTDYPSVGSSSPNASVSVEGSPTYFYNHAMHHPDEATAWITGSGVKGASAVAVTLNNSTNFDVRLYFAEPDRMKAGERVFSVSLEGNRVIADLDIASLVGSDGSGYSAAFSGIAVSDGILNVGLRASAGETILCGIEAVSVVESDGELLPEKGKRD